MILRRLALNASKWPWQIFFCTKESTYEWTSSLWQTWMPREKISVAGAPESTLRAPSGDSRHKLPEETVRNKTPQEVQVQWTWIWWWWFHFTKCFRWRLQLTGYKVTFICWRGDKLDNQSELLHHVQDILLNQALLLATLGEHMINQLHVEGACFLHFFPQTGMSRFLTKPREGFSVNITRTSNL